MKKSAFFIISFLLTAFAAAAQQPCTSKEELANVPGKYRNAANTKYPAQRAGYLAELKSPADKSVANQVLVQIENAELRSRAAFPLTGGDLGNSYSSKRYEYYGANLLGGYSFQSGFYEYFCAQNKTTVSGEYATVLRVYVNEPILNSLSGKLDYAFSWGFGTYDSMRFKDWRTTTSPSPRLALFSFLKFMDEKLVSAMNSDTGHYQDVPENKIKLGNRDLISRYWFIKKKNVPLVVEVSYKEYFQALLEYYEREKEYFTEQKTKAPANWHASYEDKKAIVQRMLVAGNAQLAQQAVVSPFNCAKSFTECGKTGYFEFNANRDPKQTIRLYKLNPAYFNNSQMNPAKPQLITAVYRYVPQPLSMRMRDNFMNNFDFAAVRKLVE